MHLKLSYFAIIWLLTSFALNAFSQSNVGENQESKSSKASCELKQLNSGSEELEKTLTEMNAASCDMINEKNSCAKKGNVFVVDADRKKMLTENMDLIQGYVKENKYGRIELKNKANEPIRNQLNGMFPVKGQEEMIKSILKLQDDLKAVGETESRTKEAYQNRITKKKIEKDLQDAGYKLKSARVKHFAELSSFLETEHRASGGTTAKSEFSWQYLNTGDGRKLSALTVKSNLHKFLAYGGIENDEGYQKVRDEVVENLLKFEHEFNCRAEIAPVDFVTSVRGDLSKEIAKNSRLKNTNLCFPSKQAAMDAVKNNSESIDKYYNNKYRSEAAIDKGTACLPRYNYGNFNVPVSFKRSCAGRFSQYFADNMWDIDSDKLSGDPEYETFKKCINDMKAQGLKLTSVNVTASSSQLNNTGEASKYFCAKGFKGLSEARGQSAKKHLVSELGFKESEVKVTSNGSNRNGSSGDCPYELVNGKERLKKEYYRGEAQREILDDAKYVKVNAVFEPEVKYGTSTGKTCWRFTRSCTQIGYKCKAWPGNKVQRGWPRRKRSTSE